MPLSWSTLHHPPLLETRVRRLVDGMVPVAAPAVSRALAIAALAGAAVTIAGTAFGGSVHHLTEALVRFLP